jgi:hypothetical protein
MAANSTPPQQTCAYMKYKYGNWLTADQIIPIDHYGTYTIMPLNSETGDRVCYRVRTPNHLEHILLDFRNKRDPFDTGVPGYGIVFYRINPLFHGNANYNGDDNLDEVYVFRRNGTPTENGTIASANFRGNLPIRNEFSPLTNPYPFVSNGDFVPIYFTNLTSGRDSMQFDFVQWVAVADYEQGELTAYPNPAERIVTVTNSIEGPLTCQLYNIQGQLLQTRTSSDARCILDLEGLPAGCYFIRTFNEERYLKTIKIIKQ